ALGNGAYPRSAHRAWPSFSAHETNFTSSRPLPASLYCLWSNSQVKVEIGYAAGSSELVMDTRKSVSGPMPFIAPAAAAVTLSNVGATNFPALFLPDPTGSLFFTA